MITEDPYRDYIAALRVLPIYDDVFGLNNAALNKPVKLFKPKSTRWHRNYEALCKYYIDANHCIYPQKSSWKNWSEFTHKIDIPQLSLRFTFPYNKDV